ncbi:MAG: hypothetical protein HC877_22155 [Thioploca sp.]|nr:hypothetical protein [Thioploca sp.]
MTQLTARNYHLVTFWSDFPEKNYATPKVRKDIREFLENSGVQVIRIDPNKLDGFESDLKAHQQIANLSGKILGTVLQYPLKPVINITQDSFEISFKALEIINKLSNHKITLVHDIKSIQSSMFGKSPTDKQ